MELNIILKKLTKTVEKIFAWHEQNKLDAQDEDFINDSKIALLNKRTPFANSILYTVAILFIVGLIWSYFATIDQVTVAEAKVIPSTQVKLIQSLDGGILSQLNVREGDTVKKDQILARLDETRYKSDYQQSYAKYLALLAMVARLSAESQGKDKIDFPSQLQSHEELTARENNEFRTRKQALAAELASLQHSYALANEQLAIQEPMVKKGIVPKIQYLQTQREANDIKTKIIQLKDQFQQNAWNDLNQRKADLSIVSESLASVQDKMVRTIIRSPVDGIVKKINIMTIGGVISPGMTIMEIVPIEDTLLVQAKLNPTDIAFIHPGEKATVKITAYDYSIYGSLKGTVEYISADTIEDSNKNLITERSLPTYYLVNVRTTRNYLGNDKHKLPIIPGMTATVHIETGEKTVLQYILKPLIKAKQEALREK